MLVRTILSQNTNDKNRDRAFDKLKETYGVLTPQNLGSAELKDLEEAIKLAGLQNQKSKRIHDISEHILKNFDGKVENILNLPANKARNKLIELKGIGNKTADIMLLFYCNQPFIPIDTHIMRVSRRLGFVQENASYEEIRNVLEGLIQRDVNAYKESHLLLIELGRDTCNARSPKCDSCVVNDFCPKLILKTKKSSKKPKKSKRAKKKR